MKLFKRNLSRYFLTLSLFAFIGTIFILSLKENGKATDIQSVAVKENVVKLSDFLGSRSGTKSNENDNAFDNRKINGFQTDSLNTGEDVAGDDGNIESDIADHENLPLDVYIFEEHHEALPYWFGAAYNGTISRTGNTLIHIDGHSDLAPPMYFPGYPFFKWPTEDQVQLLMQRNDAFIQSSIMAGLITRTIWVWPEWDRKNHEKDYTKSEVKLGWMLGNNTESNQKRKLTFCMCQNTGIKIECMYLQEGEEDGVEEVLIEPETCHIKNTVQVEEINEAIAVSLLNKEQWIQQSENVILDIDEDFFGCSYVIKPLLDANASFDALKRIDEYLMRIVCPLSTTHETNANKIMLDFVSLLLLRKSCQTDLINISECNNVDLNVNPETHLVQLLSNAKERNEINLCSKNVKSPRLLVFIKRFINGLSKLTTEQLKIIHQIGFCSSTTPKTLDIYGLPEFRLCYGANTPLESAVTEFNPTLDNVNNRAKIFRSIMLNLKQHSPKFVTLCRSVRDGYTPRNFFTTIENEILSSLKETFPHIKLHYDKDLLDGAAGRPNKQHI